MHFTSKEKTTLEISSQSYPIVDSHCHLSLLEKRHSSLKHDLELLSQKDMLLLDVGVVPEDFEKRQKQYSKYQSIYFSIGLHPNYCETYNVEEVEKLVLKHIDKAAAIGESGLDYYAQRASMEKQKEIFCLHIKLAFEYKKPLIIHARNSLDDIIQELNSFYSKNSINAKKEFSNHPMGVMHCFSGNKEQAQQCLDLGFFISFSANISYKKNVHLQEIMKSIPKEKLMLETDSPFLSHQTIRSKIINHPKNMPLLYETAAALHVTSVDSLVQNTRNNLTRFLRL